MKKRRGGRREEGLLGRREHEKELAEGEGMQQHFQ